MAWQRRAARRSGHMARGGPGIPARLQPHEQGSGGGVPWLLLLPGGERGCANGAARGHGVAREVPAGEGPFGRREMTGKLGKIKVSHVSSPEKRDGKGTRPYGHGFAKQMTCRCRGR